MTVYTAPTHLTTMQYARLQQWKQELAAIARRELHNPDDLADDEKLARWAADTLVPDAMFWWVDEKRIIPILQSAYEFAGRTIAQRCDTQEERYELLTYDAETDAQREARVASRKRLEPDGWDGLNNLLTKEHD